MFLHNGIFINSLVLTSFCKATTKLVSNWSLINNDNTYACSLDSKNFIQNKKTQKAKTKKKLVFQIVENAYLQKPLLNRIMTTQG